MTAPAAHPDDEHLIAPRCEAYVKRARPGEIDALASNTARTALQPRLRQHEAEAAFFVAHVSHEVRAAQIGERRKVQLASAAAHCFCGH
jgi:hypothetical protein